MVQRLYKTASITTAGGSVATNSFFFEPVPMGSVWTGTVEVISAPAGAFHTATISGIIWAQWGGFGPSPVLQAIAGEIIEVDSVGLLSNTVYQASIIGRWDDEINYEPVYPVNTGVLLSGPATIQPQTTSATAAGGSLTFGPFNVSAFVGMRFSLLVETGFSNALVDIRWYDTQALAQNPGPFDTNGIFDFTVLTNKSANFLIPHMADWLVIKVQSADAGVCRFHWAMANRQTGFDINDEGVATGNNDISTGAGPNSTIFVTPPVNGPWYRLRRISARANGTPAAGVLCFFFLADDALPTVKAWVSLARTVGAASEVTIDVPVDIKISNPTRLCFFNGTAIDYRLGATWEVVAPMFNFPRDT